MGVADFDKFYAQVYQERWPSLKAALLEVPQKEEYRRGLTEPYTLDRASILAAEALRLPQEGLVLDACAAPGGKSLVLASRLPPEAELLSNELSSDRRRRLVKVLDTHLEGPLRQRIRVSAFDAAALGGREKERERFAAILLDAPCSSERHVLADPRALELWTPARPKALAHRQWALLSAAFLLLAPGGGPCLLYLRHKSGGKRRRCVSFDGQIRIPSGYRSGRSRGR
jgi:16S rRNA (cytosine1407-C5)-methyltransferase